MLLHVVYSLSVKDNTKIKKDHKGLVRKLKMDNNLIQGMFPYSGDWKLEALLTGIDFLCQSLKQPGSFSLLLLVLQAMSWLICTLH